MVKVLGIPTEPREALNVILADRPRAMDVGYVNDKFFVNVSGFGFDVDVLLKHEKYKKRFKGMLPYLFGIVDALTHLRTLHLTLHDGEREEGRADSIRRQRRVHRRRHEGNALRGSL